MVWDDETIRHLRDLWTQGHSTAEIGRRLGVSKNAIVGKAHRLDLDDPETRLVEFSWPVKFRGLTGGGELLVTDDLAPWSQH